MYYIFFYIYIYIYIIDALGRFWSFLVVFGRWQLISTAINL